ncbi:calcium-binding protein 39-like [Narcine bancroftii]|uniref:calcium-binding protein 39-like n=1 Tax=Narcine bancroftii TaxID=1343680 RepID=UPI0038313496
MPFPFGKSHKSPADIVKNLKESMAVLEKQDISDKKAEKATEEVSKNLVAMKEILYGTNEKEPQTETVAQLAQELYNSGLLSTLIADLQLIDFEGKKDVAQIFNNILRRQIGTRTPTVEYICTQQNILFMLLKGCVSYFFVCIIDVLQMFLNNFLATNSHSSQKSWQGLTCKQAKYSDSALLSGLSITCIDQHGFCGRTAIVNYVFFIKAFPMVP